VVPRFVLDDSEKKTICHLQSLLTLAPDTTQRLVLSFKLGPFAGNRPRYTLNRRLGGSQVRAGRFREENNLPPLPDIVRPFLSCLVRSSVNITLYFYYY
jgi:hypothetical protein